MLLGGGRSRREIDEHLRTMTLVSVTARRDRSNIYIEREEKVSEIVNVKKSGSRCSISEIP